MDESGSASFTVTALTDPGVPLDVNFIPFNYDSEFLDTTPTASNVSRNSGETRTQTLTFAADQDAEGLYTSTITVELEDDNVDEENGEIIVSLVKGDLYLVSATEGLASVTVQDNDIPIISALNATHVIEGVAIAFELEADILPKGVLYVGYTPTNRNGTFLATTDSVGDPLGESGELRFGTASFLPSLSGDSFTATIFVPTKNVPGSTDGVITLSLEDDTDPKSYEVDDAKRSIRANVRDQTFPSISVLGGGSFSEGEMAEFNVVLNLPQARTLNVRFLPANVIGNFLGPAGAAGGPRTASVSFAQRGTEVRYTGTISVETIAYSGVDNEDGEISITLISTNDYTVSSTIATATATILDADQPQLSIESVRDTIAGSEAFFTITSNIRPSGDLSIKYIPDDLSRFFLDTSLGISGAVRTTSPLSFSLSENGQTYETILSVPTVQWAYSSNSLLQVRILAESGVYGVTNNNTANTTVVAECTESVRIPCLTIFQINPFINVDNTVEFEVVALFPQVVPLDVRVVATRGNESVNCDVLLPAYQTRLMGTCTVPQGVQSVRLSLASVPEFLPVPPHTVNYEPTVQSLPWVGVSITEDAIPEGDTFTIVAEMNPPNTGLFNVQIRVDDEDDWFDDSGGATLPTEISIIDGRGELSVPTNRRPGTSDPEGEMRVTLRPADDGSYQTHRLVRRDSVKILTAPPVLSFTAESFGGLEENQRISFFAELSRSTKDPVLISATTMDSTEGNLALDGEDYRGFEKSFEIAEGRTVVEIVVVVYDDDLNEGEEQFELVLSIPSGIDVVLPSGMESISATGIISDDEGLANLRIEPDKIRHTNTNDAGQVVINEGEKAYFTISASPPPATILYVDLRISDPGNFIQFRVGGLTMEPGQFEATYIVHTTDNSTVEPDEPITVEVLSSAGRYLAGSYGATASILVLDDDGRRSPSLNQSTATGQVSVASSVLARLLMMNASNTSGVSHSPVNDQLAAVSIEPETARISEGEIAEFTIRITQTVRSDLKVRIDISQDGKFITKNHSQTVLLPSGQLKTSILIPTIDDDVPEQDGRITAEVRESPEYSVGSLSIAHVIVEDGEDRRVRGQQLSAASRDVLPNLLAVVGSGALNAATDRIAMSFAREGSTTFELDGHSELTGILTESGELLNGGTISLRTMLEDASFAVNLYPDGIGSNLATVWGLGDSQDLTESIDNGTRSWDGEMFTGHLGFDTMAGEHTVMGLAATIATAELVHRDGSGRVVNFATQTTGIHPYIGLSSDSGNSQMRVTFGYGVGEVAIDRGLTTAEYQATNYQTVASGGDVNLLTGEFLDGEGELNVVGTSWLARQNVAASDRFAPEIRASGGQIRLAVEGTQRYETPTGENYLTTLSIGFYGEADDARSNAGLELIDRVNYDLNSDLDIEGSGRMLMSMGRPLGQWELGAKLDFDRFGDGLGVLFSTAPRLSHAGRANASVFNHDNFQSGFTPVANRTGIETEIGYGIGLFEGSSRLTPFGGFSIEPANQHEINFGSRYSVTGRNSASLVAGSRATRQEVNPDRFVRLKGSFNW